MKKYKLSWLDKGGNEVTSTEHHDWNITKARRFAASVLATTMQADVVRIKVTRAYE